MFTKNPIVGTYRAGVRVGNWFEDIALEEVGCYQSQWRQTVEYEWGLMANAVARAYNGGSGHSGVQGQILWSGVSGE